MTKITENTVKKLQAPATGYAITWDEAVKGFGVRITAAGAVAFVFNYRTKAGDQRRITIGSPPSTTVELARTAAKGHRHAVDQGKDPLADLQGERDAPTFADLAGYYIERHLPKKRTAETDKFTINKVLLPKLGKRKVAEISPNDIDAIHHRITKAGHPYRANRVLALLSKMFSLAVKPKGWRSDNPCKGIDRNHETPRERYLSEDELARLTKTLDAWPDQHTANAIRLLLYTGARRGEVLTAEWKQFDLDKGNWTKPSSHTKTKRVHTVPLSDAALAVLRKMEEARIKSGRVSPYLFPGRSGGHRIDLKKPWPAICEAANITELRVHDLRHSFASVLVSLGYTLPMIGKLLGHTQVSTTQRYAHLDVDPLRDLVNKVGAVVDGAQKVKGKIVRLR